MKQLSSALLCIGCIPIKDGKICLITTSHTKKWGIPKGGMKRGESESDTATRETFEECGCIGSSPEYLTKLGVRKATGDAVLLKVYTMNVSDQDLVFPEHKERKIRWSTLEEAKRLCPQYIPIFSLLELT